MPSAKPPQNSVDIFQQSKTNKLLELSKPPMHSFIVSKLANSFDVGSPFSVNLGHSSQNLCKSNTLIIKDTASKVLDFEDDNDDKDSRIKYNRPKAQGECSSAMLKTHSNVFASYGEEGQKLETKPEKKQNVERCQSENFLPSSRRFMNGDDELLSSFTNPLHENDEGKRLNSHKLRINKDYGRLGILHEKKYVSTYLYESVNDKELYVIKCVDNITDKEQVYQLLNEIQGNNYSGNEDAKQFIVKYYNAWIEEEKLYIVMEYCNYNLYSLGRRQSQVVEEETVKNILRNICTPLKDLHQNKLFHLKIKPENILVSKNNIYKLADLGLSKLLYQMKTANLDNLGRDTEEDFTYFAPELLSEVSSDQPHNLTKSDIFSLGISVYEFLLGLDLRNNRQAQADIKNGNFDMLERSNYSDSLKNTLKSMLDQDPTKRPSAEQLLNGFLETSAQKAAKEALQQKNNNNRLREETKGLKEKLGIKRKKTL